MSKGINSGRKRELESLPQRDLDTRQKRLDENRLYDGYADEMQAVHVENATRLDAIVRQCGWPEIS